MNDPKSWACGLRVGSCLLLPTLLAQIVDSMPDQTVHQVPAPPASDRDWLLQTEWERFHFLNATTPFLGLHVYVDRYSQPGDPTTALPHSWLRNAEIRLLAAGANIISPALLLQDACPPCDAQAAESRSSQGGAVAPVVDVFLCDPDSPHRWPLLQSCVPDATGVSFQWVLDSWKQKLVQDTGPYILFQGQSSSPASAPSTDP